MASAFFETMSMSYALPVAECDLNITSKQQYGIISGVWFVGEKNSNLRLCNEHEAAREMFLISQTEDRFYLNDLFVLFFRCQVSFYHHIYGGSLVTHMEDEKF